MIDSSIVKELKKVFKGDIWADAKTLDTYSRDTSLFEIKPQLVVAPKDVNDVKELVQFAKEHKVSLTGRSGGTGMDGGALTESIVVSFAHYLNRIKEVVEEDLGEDIAGYATVEPGCFYRDFEKATLAKNLLMPSYPASREICAVGGMFANNAGGELTLQYGKTENYIKQVKVVLYDGNEYVIKPLEKVELDEKLMQKDFEGDLYRSIYKLITENKALLKEAKPRVSKNSAGYYLWNVWDAEKEMFDLTKLFVGSQGTLGLVTEITYKLVRPQKHSQMVIFYLDDLDRLGDMVQTVLKHNPTTFESYDDKTMKLAMKFFWEFIKRLGVKNIFTIIKNSIPEGLSILKHGIPKLVLQITFDGDEPHVLREKALAMAQDVSVYHPRYAEVIKDPKEAEEYWLIRRESFNLLRHKVKGKKTAPFIDDIVVPVEELPVFLPKLNKILDQYNDYMIHNIAGHIGNGNFHIIPLMDLRNAKARAIIPEVAQRVYDLVLTHHGSTTGEHNDGVIRTPFVKQQFGEKVYKLFEQTKKIFDPTNIFNPGKKVEAPKVSQGEPRAGTIEYAVEHMKKHN